MTPAIIITIISIIIVLACFVFITVIANRKGNPNVPKTAQNKRIEKAVKRRQITTLTVVLIFFAIIAARNWSTAKEDFTSWASSWGSSRRLPAHQSAITPSTRIPTAIARRKLERPPTRRRIPVKTPVKPHRRGIGSHAGCGPQRTMQLNPHPWKAQKEKIPKVLTQERMVRKLNTLLRLQ